ncbi:hypothetical protein ONZ43_g2456 [Nemania bipapillata]|uniref:Uncharacterized protein n=1 Tax=Nemania bipapillata TaxID=110536 RepID=A0ACC2J0L1_9PEZI|nr:hypothetical protein ONZ43_g2456 [Nemania bipapillata]
MDPVTILTALSQLLELASSVSNILNFICSAHTAPLDIQKARDEIASHLTLFKSVQCLIERGENYAVHFSSLVGPDGPINASMQAIHDLSSLIGENPSERNHRDRFLTVLANFKNVTLDEITWAVKQRQIREIRARLERQKTSTSIALSAAVTSITLSVSKESINRAQRIHESLKETNDKFSEMEKKNILDHCLPPNDNITTIHKDRKSQQEPETCGWVSREADFIAWLKPHNSYSKSCRFICIHGIPGAGKTVLASSLIEIAASNCRSRGYAYYYCLYSRKQDEAVPFLKWALRQLCKQKQIILPKIKDAYEREDGLSVEDLLDCLEQVSFAYENGVYIIVDAVDESKPRENILKVLVEIGTNERFRNVSLLFTCREENEIMGQVQLLGKRCARISMSNANVRCDIKHYIHAQLATVPFFVRCEDDAFLEEVETTLTQKAKGMFRWAVCQLDVLKRKRDRGSIREALETLPGDIFATYERILVEIPEGDREFAKTALALICSDTAEIPSAEVLVHACLYNVPFNEIGRFSVPTLKETCGSLISLSVLNRAPASRFPRSNEEPQKFHPNLANLAWRDLANKYLESPDFKDLPRKEKTKVWSERFKIRERRRETLLGYCVDKCYLKFLRVLVRHGASFEREPEVLYTVMKVFTDSDRVLEALKFLLGAGADPNPKPANYEDEPHQTQAGFAFTPLQLAVYLLEYEWVELLLDENADVNKIGTPDGVIPSRWDDPDAQSDEARALQAIAQQSVLEICSYAQPDWIRESGSNGEAARESIRELLKRHGAEDRDEGARDGDMDESMGDGTTTSDGMNDFIR